MRGGCTRRTSPKPMPKRSSASSRGGISGGGFSAPASDTALGASFGISSGRKPHRVPTGRPANERLDARADAAFAACIRWARGGTRRWPRSWAAAPATGRRSNAVLVKLTAVGTWLSRNPSPRHRLSSSVLYTTVAREGSSNSFVGMYLWRAARDSQRLLYDENGLRRDTRTSPLGSEFRIPSTPLSQNSE